MLQRNHTDIASAGIRSGRVRYLKFQGLCFADVRQLKLVRHLHATLWAWVWRRWTSWLQYRSQVRKMQRRLDEMEQRLRQKEQAHQVEILAFRRQSAEDVG